MSDSVRPQRWQPTRLPYPWDSPGKNTGVGCHFLFQRMKVKSESEVVQSCPTLSDPMDCSLPGSSVHGIFQARVLEWVALPSPTISTTFLLQPLLILNFLGICYPNTILSFETYTKWAWITHPIFGDQSHLPTQGLIFHGHILFWSPATTKISV